MIKEKKHTFETALKRLEEIVALLEDEKLPLEEALGRYEEGIGIARFCARSLDAAEKKIEILAKNAEGAQTVTAFNPGAERVPGEAPEPAKKRGARPRDDEGDPDGQFLF